GAALNACDVFGMTPLMEAVYFGHKEAVLCLLSSGADVSYRIQGEPLMDFVIGTPTSYFKQEKWLVQRNVVARLCKTNGWNASHLAAHRGFTDILTILLNYGADLDIKDNAGLAPVNLAVKNGH
ncbi:ankyrin repeat-containing domain protein, partial [Phaeosphaeria sp. MPI-PUGE-AT-0046c]